MKISEKDFTALTELADSVIFELEKSSVSDAMSRISSLRNLLTTFTMIKNTWTYHQCEAIPVNFIGTLIYGIEKQGWEFVTSNHCGFLMQGKIMIGDNKNIIPAYSVVFRKEHPVNETVQPPVMDFLSKEHK